MPLWIRAAWIRAAALLLAAGLAAGAVGCESEEPDVFASPPAHPLSADEAGRLYAALERGDPALGALLDEVVARGDHRFVAVLIEALRASRSASSPAATTRPRWWRSSVSAASRSEPTGSPG